MIDLRKLEHFVAVAKERSFVRAAEGLHLSQPALSRSIQALERHFGARLFDRTRFEVQLTAVGKQLLELSSDLLYNAAQLDESVASASRGLSGTVRFGLAPLAAAVSVASLAKTLMQSHPSLSVRIVTASTQQMTELLAEGEIEFFVGRASFDTVPSRLKVDVLNHVRPEVIVRANHPLTRFKTVNIVDLETYPRLAASTWNDTVTHHFTGREREALLASIVFDNINVLSEIVGQTDAVLISTFAGPTSIHRVLPIVWSAPVPAVTVGQFTLRSRTLSPAAKLVSSIIRKELGSVWTSDS
ncbi:MAG: LysR family transcriptional regulator [Mycetocola sp.]